MSSANAGWLFYKKMYHHLYENENTRPLTLDNNYVSSVNSEVLGTELQESPSFPTKHHFSLTTIYPGLVIGTGYNHNAKDCKDNFDFGFFFEHTTGMPLIPGSSIKGVIRSIFKKLDNETQKESVVSYFKSMFSDYKISIALNASLDENIEILQKIEKHIFDGIDGQGKQLALYDRDKFFDAVVIEGDTVRIGGREKVLVFADDYITPHGTDTTIEGIPGYMKEPEPNHMLKVRSGVTFKFNFDLQDSLINENIHLLAHQKLQLFQGILEFHGVGAKTNVGYGQFEVKEEIKSQNTTEGAGSPDAIPEKTFVMIKNEIENTDKGKSIKNKIKKMSFNNEEKEELLPLICEKIQKEKSLESTWYGSSISEWMELEGLSNSDRKKLVGNDYFDILKKLYK